MSISKQSAVITGLVMMIVGFVMFSTEDLPALYRAGGGLALIIGASFLDTAYIGR